MPTPDLETFEEVIRQRLEALQQRVGELEEAGSDGELAEAYGTLGKHYLAHTLTDAAEAAFSNARSLAPDDARWIYYLAHIQERMGDHAAALASYKRVLELEPGDVPTLLHLGEVCLETGENDSAHRYFRQALELNPEEAAAHAGIGRAAAALDRPHEAAAELRRALELQPQASALHYPLALAYRNLGQMEAARAELHLRGETPVRFSDPLLNEIGPLQRGDLIEAVVEMAGKADEIDDRSLADFAIGHLGSDPAAPQKLLAAVAEISEEAVDDNRASRARLHYVVAGLSYSRGDLGRSMVELEKALSLAPQMTDAAILRGHISERRGDLEEAASLYTQILDRQPENIDALRARARTRFELDDLRGAISDLESLCEREPAKGEHWIQLAIAHARLDELDLARENYQRALEIVLDPAEAAQVHYHLGIIAGRDGSIDTAIVEFRAAVELDPDFVQARLDLAAAFGSQSLYNEAAAAYREVLARDPTNLYGWMGAATAMNLAGDSKGAVALLEEGWDQNPGSVELLHALARILASAADPELRDGERAVDLASRTFRAGTTVERLETLAMALAEAGRFSEAVTKQKEAIAMAGWRGRTDIVPTLEANLARYEAGQSCCAASNRSE